MVTYFIGDITDVQIMLVILLGLAIHSWYEAFVQGDIILGH